MSAVTLDLRGPAKASVANDPNPGMGLFSDQGHLWLGPWQWYSLGEEGEYWGAPASVAGYLDLGGDPLARMRVAARNGLADQLELSRAVLPDSSLAEILAHYVLGPLADPTGRSRVKPLRMGRRGLKLRLGSFGEVLSEPFSMNHPNFEATLSVRQADYRRQGKAGVPLEALQRWTGNDARDLFARDVSRESINDILDRLLPSEYLADGANPRDTEVGDTFDRADNTDLNAADTGKTLNGGAATWQWTEVLNDLMIASNLLSNVTAGGDQITGRIEQDLSSDDHYCEGALTITTNLNGRFSGVAGRFAAAADTCYWGGTDRETDLFEDFIIYKREAGVDTALFTASNVDVAIGSVLSLEINGSALDLLYNSVSRTSGIDTAITGNLRVGVLMNGQNGANRVRFNNLVGADLAVQLPVPILMHEYN